MDKFPMTFRGKKMLEDELHELLHIQRPANIKAIEEARGHGDLSENADYDAAKEKQGFIEARVSHIQNQLAGAEVVNPKEIKADRIVFGATVELLNLDTEDKVKYQIVGLDEADVKQGLISVFSPLGRALIGKKKNDVVELMSPKGDKEFEVLKFQYK